jgi:hypothetical protein
VSAAVCCVWYFKNFFDYGNPVYPFFYGAFGGKNWNQFQADIYANEQRTFGYQGLLHAGHSLMGLVTNPGRFTNPGQSVGAGFPFVSLGFAAMIGGITGIVAGNVKEAGEMAERRVLLWCVLLQLGFWLVLTQQSRYILVLLVPLIVLMASVLESRIGVLLKGIVLAQIPVTIWLIFSNVIFERVPAILGTVSQDDFISGYVDVDGMPAHGAVRIGMLAVYAKANPEVKKVALYDEVLGYYLPCSYIWANPGHSTELDYSKIKTSEDLVRTLKSMGVTHIYMDLQSFPGGNANIRRWMAALQPSAPYPADEPMRANDETRWRVLIADGILKRQMVLVTAFARSRLLIKIL